MSPNRRQELVQLLDQFIDDKSELQAIMDGAPLRSTLSMDSMRLLDLVVRIEERFGVSFEYEDIDRALESFDTLLNHLSN